MKKLPKISKTEFIKLHIKYAKCSLKKSKDKDKKEMLKKLIDRLYEDLVEAEIDGKYI